MNSVKGSKWSFRTGILLIMLVLLSACGPAARDLDSPERSKLLEAATEGPLSYVRSLLEAGVDPNDGTDFGYTALMGAAGRGRIEVVQMLLAAGADVRKRDNEGWTVLMSVAVSKSATAELTELLLAAGADPCPKGLYREHRVTALALARKYNRGIVGLIEGASRSC